MNWTRLWQLFGDLWLVSEGSIEWVKEPRIRRVWQLDFLSIWCIVFAKLVLGSSLERLQETSSSATLVWRCFLVLAYIWMLLLEAYTAYLYYRYLLLKGKDIRF